MELRENKTAQKKKETEVTPPRKSPVRRVKVKGLHRKKTTPKNIQEVTPPTPERKCSRQTIAKMKEETMTGIWTDSDVSLPKSPKIITNPIQARKITEMKVTMTSQEDMKNIWESRRDSWDSTKERKEEDSYTDKKKHEKASPKGKKDTSYNSQNKRK